MGKTHTIKFKYNLLNYDLLASPREKRLPLNRVTVVGLQTHRLANPLNERYCTVTAFYISYEGNVYGLEGMTEEEWDDLVAFADDTPPAGGGGQGLVPSDLEVTVTATGGTINDGDAVVDLLHLAGWRIRLFRDKVKQRATKVENDFYYTWDMAAGRLRLYPAASEGELIQIEPY